MLTLPDYATKDKAVRPSPLDEGQELSGSPNDRMDSSPRQPRRLLDRHGGCGCVGDRRRDRIQAAKMNLRSPTQNEGSGEAQYRVAPHRSCRPLEGRRGEWSLRGDLMKLRDVLFCGPNIRAQLGS